MCSVSKHSSLPLIFCFRSNSEFYLKRIGLKKIDLLISLPILTPFSSIHEL